MRLSERIEQGQSLPRGQWGPVDPRTRVVPAKRGKGALYQRQPRRKADHTEEHD